MNGLTTYEEYEVVMIGNEESGCPKEPFQMSDEPCGLETGLPSAMCTHLQKDL